MRSVGSVEVSATVHIALRICFWFSLRAALHAHLWAFCLESCFQITTFLCRNASQVSYWRYRIESVKDITVQTFIDQYTEEAGAESTCDPDLENLYQDDENQIGY